MAQEMKTRPSYAISSVDHALHIATMLQLEGRLTVSEAAQRLGIARSTAHRLLTMLVYRDFAVQDESRVYHAGPVLELAAHSPSEASRLRTIALPHLASRRRRPRRVRQPHRADRRHRAVHRLGRVPAVAAGRQP